jgi:type 1 glutamine amidotransferase
MSGYQADFDASATYAGILYEERGRGILARRGKKVVIHEDGRLEDVGVTTEEQTIIDVLKKEDWNEYHIIAQGNHLIQSINGHVTVEVIDNQTSKRSLSGLLGLQLHAGPPMKVQFKDIQLKRLPADAESADSTAAPGKKVVFLAGGRSHGTGSHEHYAGCRLLARYLEENLPGYQTDVYRGWPSEGLAALEGADAVVVFCDGGGGHLLIPHLDELNTLMDQGVGLACLHYAVEVPKGEAGDAFLRWLGGYFEVNWSVNPHWRAEFKQLPQHPITRGVRPFAIEDEWYFHMRFRPLMEGVTPILSAHPPAGRKWQWPDGARSGNPSVRAALERGEAQHLAWASERPDGGRGFGFTGGHWHRNWAEDNFRKTVLNGIVWVARGQVPEGGVGGKTPTAEELEANQD